MATDLRYTWCQQQLICCTGILDSLAKTILMVLAALVIDQMPLQYVGAN
jgi:hypothetical protein